MIALSVLGLTLQLSATAVADTARLSGERLLVEPLGFSFQVPPLWLGRLGPAGLSFCDAHPSGTIADRILTERSRFPTLRSPRGEMKREYAAVVDSVMPFSALVAHLGGDPWNGSCAAPQMRVYISDPAALSVRSLIPRGIQSAERAFPPVSRADADSSGWQIIRLSWSGWHYDYGFTAQVEFWSRPVQDRIVTLVFMYLPYVEHHKAMLTEIVRSARF